MFYFSWLHWKERFLDCARVHITLKTLVIGLISNRRSLFPTFCWEVSGAAVFLLWHLQVSFWKASIRLFHSSRKGKNGRPCYLHYLKKMDKYFSWFFLRCICYKAVLMIHKTKLFLTLRVLGYIYTHEYWTPHNYPGSSVLSLKMRLQAIFRHRRMYKASEKRAASQKLSWGSERFSIELWHTEQDMEGMGWTVKICSMHTPHQVSSSSSKLFLNDGNFI